MRLTRYILVLLFICTGVLSCKDSEEDILKEHSDGAYEDLTLLDRTPRKIEYLIMHCSATPATSQWDTERLKKFFITPINKGGRGWDRYGYHYVIERNGTEKVMTPLDSDEYLQQDEIVYGAAGYNSNSINIVLIGGTKMVKGKLVDEDNFTVQQVLTARATINYYRARFPWIKVIGHNAVARKSCPVINMLKLTS